MIFTLYYIYATMLQWFRLGTLKNKIKGTLNHQNALLVCSGVAISDPKNHRCLETLLFHNEDKLGCTVVPKQKINLNNWVQFPKDEKFFPIHIGNTKTVLSGSKIYILLSAQLDKYLAHEGEVIQIETFGEPLAWKASENFEVILKSDDDNLTKLVNYFSSHNLDINHELRLLKLETVDVEGVAAKIKYDKKFSLEQRLKYSHSPVHWRKFVKDVNCIYQKLNESNNNPKITIESGSKSDDSSKRPVSEVKPMRGSKSEEKHRSERKNTLEVQTRTKTKTERSREERDKSKEKEHKSKKGDDRTKEAEPKPKDSEHKNGEAETKVKESDCKEEQKLEKKHREHKHKDDKKHKEKHDTEVSHVSGEPEAGKSDHAKNKNHSKKILQENGVEDTVIGKTLEAKQKPIGTATSPREESLVSVTKSFILQETEAADHKEFEKEKPKVSPSKMEIPIINEPGTSSHSHDKLSSDAKKEHTKAKSSKTKDKTKERKEKPKDQDKKKLAGADIEKVEGNSKIATTVEAIVVKPEDEAKSHDTLVDKTEETKVMAQSSSFIKEEIKASDLKGGGSDQNKQEPKIKIDSKTEETTGKDDAKKPKDDQKSKDDKKKKSETKLKDSKSKEDKKSRDRSRESTESAKSSKSHDKTKEKETKPKEEGHKKSIFSVGRSKDSKNKDKSKKDESKAKADESKVKIESTKAEEPKASTSASVNFSAFRENLKKTAQCVRQYSTDESRSKSMMESFMKPPSVYVYSDSQSTGENVISVLNSMLNKDKYLVKNLTLETKDFFNDPSTVLIVVCGNVMPNLAILLIDFMIRGGQLLCICSDFLLNILQTFTTAEVRENELVRFSYRDWKRVKMMHHIFCYQASPARKQFSKDSDQSSTEGSSPIAPRTPSAVQIQHNGKHHTVEVQILGIEETWASPSLLLATVKNGHRGRAIFSQVHLEIDPLEYEEDEAKFGALKDSNKARLEILKDILSNCLDLDCELTKSAPMFKPGYFLGTYDLKMDLLKSCPDIQENQLINSKLKIFFCGKNADPGEANENNLPIMIHSCPTDFSTVKYFETLNTEHIGRLVLYVDTLSSSQNVLEKKLHHGLAVIVRSQTSGVGRSDNIWVSPLGCAMFSLQLHIKLDSPFGRSLSLIQHFIMTAIVGAVKEKLKTEDLPICIKWPNDLYWGKNCKIGGVVVKTTLESDTAIVNIGCGVNLDNETPTSCLNKLISDKSEPIPYEEYFAIVFNEMERIYNKVQNGEMQYLLDLYQSNWMHSDQEITVKTADGSSQEVKIIGIDEFGYLKVQTLDGKNTSSVHPDGNTFDMLQGLIAPKL